MKRAVIVLFVLVLAAPAHAQGPRVRSSGRTLAGVLLIAGGAGLVAGAYDDRRDCFGYRSTFGGPSFVFYQTSDYCAAAYERRVHVEEMPWDTRLARRPMLYAGLGAIAFGTLLTTIWSDVPVARDLDVQVGPDRVTVGRTFGF